MPAYVTTPNGETLMYADANYAVRAERCTELYESKEKNRWIADVPKSWAVGWSRPRVVGVADAAEELRRDIRSAPGSALAGIKRALRLFDARTHSWRA